MSLECAIDYEYFVELDEFGAISPGTEFCIECGRLIPQSEEHYLVREFMTGEDYDDLIHLGVHAICESCGDLAISWLDLGYCWTYGELRNDIAELRRNEQDHGIHTDHATRIRANPETSISRSQR